MGKKFKLKKCGSCGSYNLNLVTKNNNITWICHCGWEGKRPLSDEISEEEYLKYAEKLE